MRDLSQTTPAVIRQPLVFSDLALLAEYLPDRYPHLLESVAKGDPNQTDSLGRFDILFAFPQHTHVLQDLDSASAFIEQFEAEFAILKQPPGLVVDLPFSGGWFGYFSYEYAQVIEPCLALAESTLPLAVLQRFPAAIVVDHQTQQVCFVAEPEYAAYLEQMQADYTAFTQRSQDMDRFPSVVVERVQEEADTSFLQGVETIKNYILAGDVFQVNLSREWQIDLQENSKPIDLYRQLRQHNPAPFACLVQFSESSGEHQDSWAIISSSPERLVRYNAQNQCVDTRPIAGTRKRSGSLEQDQALMAELISHPKERAEHIMLIDLERNDLGRICTPGSVEVNELMVIETYEHVHHIVSNVRGQLKSGMSPLQVLHALFPGGTITGCPKIRCMQIIAELESGPRDAYTGSVGYINRDGSMDFNILIRSFIQQQDQLRFRAGGGIVADSIAANELEETRHKAKGLLRALGCETEEVQP